MSAASFVATLIGSNLRIGLLIAIVFGALRIARAGDGAFRHRVWLVTLGGCLLLPMLESVVPALPIPILSASAPLPPFDPAASAVTSVIADDDVTKTAGVTALYGMLPGLGLWIYGSGVACVLGLFFFSVWRMARRERGIAGWDDAEVNGLKDSLCRELGIRRPVRLLRSDGTGSPFTWRALKPSVVLPSSAVEWSPQRMRNALLHELGHIKRFDWAWLWLLRVVAAVYWFNPLVWIAVRECRFEAERACDDLVLGAGGESSEYAEQLLDLMASSRASGVAIALGSSFPKRIRAILNASQEVRVMGRIRKGIAFSVIALLVTVLAACQVTTGQPVGDDDSASAERALNEQRLSNEQARLDEAARLDERARLEEQERLEAFAVNEQAQARAEQQRLEAAARADEFARQRALEEYAQRAEAEAARQQAERAAVAGREAARAEAAVAADERSAEAVRFMQERVVALERLLQERQAGIEQVRVASAADDQRLAELALVLEQRTAALRETKIQLQRQAEAIEQLRITVDQQNAELRDRERALAELEAQLRETEQ